MEEKRKISNLKITINTNVAYGKQLSILIRSMHDSGYNDFRNLIIVVSGSSQDKEPYIGSIKEIFPDYEFPNIECCIVLAKMENFEYTAYHMLYVYREHDLVISKRYISLMDTCIVDHTFKDKIKYLSNFTPKGAKGAWLYGCKGYRVSNLFLFSRDVVLNYKNNFETLVDKVTAVYLEGGSCESVKEKEICGLHNFGEFFDTGGHRRRLAAEDIYGTGIPRTPYYFNFLGLKKYVMLMWQGDIKGDLERIDLPLHERRGEKEIDEKALKELKLREIK